jgi:predicted RNA-binding protein with PIN domain
VTVDERRRSETGDDGDHVGLPIPETLLAPLLDDAAALLARYDGELPSVLRPLAGFDARGLRSGPARQQLHRALDVDGPFRSQVAERFAARPEVEAVLDAWDPGAAMRKIAEAADRSDLAILASALFAVRPRGWAFGLGLAYAAFDGQRREKERDDDAKARDTQLATLDEARRRAENARDAAQREVDRLETQLRGERRTRREKELHADRAVEEATRRRQEAEALSARAEAAAAEADARLGREADRARAAEAELRTLRRERAAATADHAAAGAGLSDDELRAITDAAADAERVATRLRAIAALSARAPAPPAAAPTTTTTRVKVPCPPGMRADTADALDAMLRTRGVQLVVDGYNVSMAGWRDDPPAVQRDRLVTALERLHLRLRVDVTVVFDGADVAASSPGRRSGVRVVFSAADEEADPVVIREVEGLPPATPAVVASSDGWVREHAEAAGAQVVPAAALLDVLRR